MTALFIITLNLFILSMVVNVALLDHIKKLRSALQRERRGRAFDKVLTLCAAGGSLILHLWGKN